MSALPEDSDSWAQCRQKAPVVAAAELQKQKILCLLLCLPDFWLILKIVIFLRYNAPEIWRNYVTNSEQGRAVREQEREKWNLNASGRKQCLQVAGALVQFLSPLLQFLSALLCCRWLAEVTNCTCQHCSHTRGLEGSSTSPSLHKPDLRRGDHCLQQGTSRMLTKPTWHYTTHGRYF